MDSSSDKAPGLGLPPPSFEQGGSEFGGSQAARTPESMAGAGEMQPAQAAPATTAVQPAAVSPITVPVPDPQALTPPISAAAPADDSSDDLDQEWVNKAKAIVEKTRSDPFLESKELSKVKADYLKTRYNKHIKIAEDSS
jgi:hypothetical protein